MSVFFVVTIISPLLIWGKKKKKKSHLVNFLKTTIQAKKKIMISLAINSIDRNECDFNQHFFHYLIILKLGQILRIFVKLYAHLLTFSIMFYFLSSPLQRCIFWCISKQYYIIYLCISLSVLYLPVLLHIISIHTFITHNGALS